MLATTTVCLSAGPNTSIEFNSVQDFLNLLKSPEASQRKFDSKNAPHWNTARLLPLLSKDGVSISEATPPKTQIYKVDRIDKELASRNGGAFTTFAHISFLLSHPRKQYSSVSLTHRGSTEVATISTFYKLTFTEVGGSFKLSKIEDINSGD